MNHRAMREIKRNDDYQFVLKFLKDNLTIQSSDLPYIKQKAGKVLDHMHDFGILERTKPNGVWIYTVSNVNKLKKYMEEM